MSFVPGKGAEDVDEVDEGKGVDKDECDLDAMEDVANVGNVVVFRVSVLTTLTTRNNDRMTAITFNVN